MTGIKGNHESKTLNTASPIPVTVPNVSVVRPPELETFCNPPTMLLKSMNMKMYHTKFTLSSDYQNHKESFLLQKLVKITNTKNCKDYFK